MKYILFITLFLASCSTHYTLKNNNGDALKLCTKQNLYIVSERLPEYFVEHIKNAANYWNSALGYKAFVYGGTYNLKEKKSMSLATIVIDVDDFSGLFNRSQCVSVKLKLHNNICITGSESTIHNKCVSDIDEFETFVRQLFGINMGLKPIIKAGDVMNYYRDPGAQHPIDATKKEIEIVKGI